MEKLKLGDIVRLKSGGPLMIISDYASTGKWIKGPTGRIPILETEKVVCNWYDEGVSRVGIFALSVLEHCPTHSI